MAGVGGSGTAEPPPHIANTQRPRTMLAEPTSAPSTRCDCGHAHEPRRLESEGSLLASISLPSPGSSSLRTNNVCFGEAEPTPKHTRRASSSQGGAPVKSLGDDKHRFTSRPHRPNFLRGGCLDGSAAAATAQRHSEAEIVSEALRTNGAQQSRPMRAEVVRRRWENGP